MTQVPDKSPSNVARQAWLGLAFWLSLGLLLEGLIGFRAPVYLQDPLRRELFRLAHAHGAILSLVLLIAVLCIERGLTSPPKMGILSLRVGVVAMPIGFLLGGIWHYESDPGMGIFLAPLGGLLVIFGVISLALANRSGS